MVGGWWRLAVGGGWWRLAVGGPWRLSLKEKLGLSRTALVRHGRCSTAPSDHLLALAVLVRVEAGRDAAVQQPLVRGQQPQGLVQLPDQRPPLLDLRLVAQPHGAVHAAVDLVPLGRQLVRVDVDGQHVPRGQGDALAPHLRGGGAKGDPMWGLWAQIPPPTFCPVAGGGSLGGGGVGGYPNGHPSQ